jgi:hypothetical protein
MPKPVTRYARCWSRRSQKKLLKRYHGPGSRLRTFERHTRPGYIEELHEERQMSTGVFDSSDAQVPAVDATGTDGATGVIGTTDSGTGVSGTATLGFGVQGTALGNPNGFGVGVSAQALNQADIALQVIGRVQIQGSSVGLVTMAKETKTLTVSNAAATPDSHIFLTPLGDPLAFFGISARSEGSFTIKASHALSANADISFLIIN